MSYFSTDIYTIWNLFYLGLKNERVLPFILFQRPSYDLNDQCLKYFSKAKKIIEFMQSSLFKEGTISADNSKAVRSNSIAKINELYLI